jgi:xylulokinase
LLLTVDLGSTVTKVVLWAEDGPVATGRSVLRTNRLDGGIAEQDPSDWWRSVIAACTDAAAVIGGHGGFDAVQGIAFSAARQTFVAVDPQLRPLSPGIMWSDRRAGEEARELAGLFGDAHSSENGSGRGSGGNSGSGALSGVEAVRRKTGMILDSAAPAAKLAWLDRHEPGLLHEARWVLAPRDLVVGRLTGEVCTDATLAQSSGLYDSSLVVVPELVGAHGDLLPPVLAPDAVAGELRADAASELGLPAGIPVVVGAGDRPCEVLGTAGTGERPMVSWGTTANVSVPIEEWPSDWELPRFRRVVVSRGAAGGFLVEAGLSSAGSFVEWIAGLGGIAGLSGSGGGVPELLELAAASPPGAKGVTATCWLGGARAPWWRDDARAAFFGLAPQHTAGDLARAAIESVAFDIRRCLEADGPTAIAMAGGSGSELWQQILCGVTGLRATRRESGLGASAGAALLAGPGTGFEASLEAIDPAAPQIEPDQTLFRIYDEIRASSDAAADAALGLGQP